MKILTRREPHNKIRSENTFTLWEARTSWMGIPRSTDLLNDPSLNCGIWVDGTAGGKGWPRIACWVMLCESYRLHMTM